MQQLLPVKYVIIDNVIFYPKGSKINKKNFNFKNNFEADITSPIRIDISSFNEKKVVYIYEWNEIIVETLNTNIFFEEHFIELGEYLREDLGILYFKDSIGPRKFLNINLFILSLKLSYEEFFSTINYLNEKIINLSFSLTSSTKLNAHRSFNLPSDLNYQSFLYLLNIFDENNKTNVFKFLNIILNSPHKNMIKKLTKINSLFIDDFDSDIIEEIAANTTNLITVTNSNIVSNALSMSHNNYFPEEINVKKTFDTMNTTENIFIKYFLMHCKFILLTFNNKLKSHKDNIYIKSLIVKSTYIIKKIDYILSTTFLKDVDNLKNLLFNSSVLQRKYGYKQIFNYYLKIKNAPKPLIDNNLMEEFMNGKLLSTLYEYFCYFKIIDIISEIYETPPIINNNITTSMFSKILSKTGTNCVFSSIDNTLPTIVVNYNKTYKQPESYSKEYDPDISIELFKNNNVTDILIFDAKFKLKHNDFKAEDLDKMHTYKDAIKKCVGAFVLFPGDNKNTVFNIKKDTLTCYGVGAYSLQINSTNLDLITKNIQDFIKIKNY